MSLLLQALQKAAKNRELSQRADAPADVPPVPLTTDLDIPASAFDLPRGPSLEIEPGDIEPPTIAKTVEREPRRIEAIPEPEPVPTPQQAAAVIGAATIGRDAKFNMIDWIRDHPVPALLIGLAPFAIGYGAYVFIAVSNPGFFTRSTPTLTAGAGNIQRTQQSSAAQPTRVAQAEPNPTAPMPDLGSRGSSPTAVPAAPTPPSAATPSATNPAASSGSTVPAAAATATGVVAGAASAANAATPVEVKPVQSAAPVMSEGTVAETKLESVRSARKPNANVDPERAAAATARATAKATKVPVVPIQDEVQVRSTDSSAGLTALLSEGYQLMEAGQIEKAKNAYGRALALDNRNTDALLGLAAADWQSGNTESASGRYYRVLEIDPQNADAQAGLIAMLGRIDPVSSETRLKQLIAREPSGGLYFALGNLYSQQGQWSSAQQSYFQALQLDATHPDYAYNLAVSLEHIGQRKIALDYYRKAIDFAKVKGHAGFDRGLAAARVSQLTQTQ